MNTYNVIFKNRMRATLDKSFVISAPSRSEAVRRGQALLSSAGGKLAHYMRPIVTTRGTEQ